MYFLNVQIVLKNLQPIQQLAGKLPASRHKAKLICSEISRLTRANFHPLDSSPGLRKPNFPKLFELLSHRKASMKCVLRSSFGNPSTLLSLSLRVSAHNSLANAKQWQFFSAGGCLVSTQYFNEELKNNKNSNKNV